MTHRSTLSALLALTLLSAPLAAQKKPLDHSVYDSWQSVGATDLSAKGQVLSYEIRPQEGDGTLTFRVLGKRGREITIPRGYRAQITDDEAYAVCLIKPQFQKTRRARIDKKKPEQMPKDSLAVISLATGDVVKFPDVKSYQMGKFASSAFAFATTDTTFVPKKERKAKDKGTPLAVYHFGSGRIDTLRNIEHYVFSRDGAQLGLVKKTGKKHMQAGFFDVSAASLNILPDTSAWVGTPVFDQTGQRALFLSADDTLSTGSKHPKLFLYTVSGQNVRELPSTGAGVPEGWGITENSQPLFSHDGEKILVGIQEFEPPKDTTLVPFETPGLDIWNWDSPFLPPREKVNLKEERKHTYPAVVTDGGLLPLQTSRLARLMPGNRWDAPVALYMESLNPIERQWNGNGEVIVSLISLADGSRKEIARGPLSDVRLSPEARTVIWWDYGTRSWTLYDVASARTVPVKVDVPLWDEDNDTPGLPDSYGIAGWTGGDASLILYDRYDLWQVPADGAAPVRLTRGREAGVTYRYINTKDHEEERHIGPAETLLLSVFDHGTKENGLASVNLARPEKTFRTLVKGGFTWSGLKKARLADVYLYQKGNFTCPMDAYLSSSLGKTEEKLTAINPQQADYNWGTAELYRWTAYDGEQLEGILYKPEDFDPDKKYPMMVYFYERNSETLYRNHPVQPSWSIINIPFYVSRGYLVFVPDIVYHTGTPGEAAYNCIVSGTESLTRFPWVDKDNMAIQGQSWGGYQVAYLVTRTGMYKAAGAGAPVANMTSAYGGIRWESGSSRQIQYEQGQSRIGRDLWSGTELYLENSPLFKLPAVTTPLLIMHNDADGAVPWYQGIELFMGLRRLGKPAWLLEYNDEAHNLRQRRNRKDLSIRLQQFFDHYLKGAPEPAWMRDGIPTAKKDYYFGYEQD